MHPEAYLRRTLYNLAADRWRRQQAWRRKLASARTYMPVRLVSRRHGFGFRIDFRWLPPTKANLASLHVHIPAGYRHV